MLRNVFLFYKDGFLNMKLGKSLWLIILLKIFIMFAIIKPFFPNILNKNYASFEQRAEAVSKNLILKGEQSGSFTKRPD